MSPCPASTLALLGLLTVTSGCTRAEAVVQATYGPNGAGPTASPRVAPSLGPKPRGPAPVDVTRRASARFAPRADASVSSPTGKPSGSSAPARPPTVVHADPLAVATGFVAARLTYRFDDLSGYQAAMTAPRFTTPRFSLRSQPNGAQLARIKTAQETSVVRVGRAQLASEAPNNATTQYVAVTCTVTTIYRGGGDTAAAAWTLRLLKVGPGQWRVDGVLSVD